MLVDLKRFIVCASCLIIAVLCSLSVLFYNPTDQSWFYADTKGQAIKNILGLYGAQAAGLLLFVFGITVWLVILGLLVVAYKIWNYEWSLKSLDQYGAFMVLIPTMATMVQNITMRTSYSYCPGGYIGYMLNKKLSTLFPEECILILLTVLVLCCITLITRLAFVTYLCWLVGKIGYLRAGVILEKPFGFINKHVLSWYNVLIHFFGKPFDHAQKILLIEEIIQEEFKQSPESIVWGSLIKKDVVLAKQTVKESNSNPPVPPSFEQVTKNTLNPKNYKSENETYRLPAKELFTIKNNSQEIKNTTKESHYLAEILEQKLERFGIVGKVTAIYNGPVITLFEYQPHIDTKISKIIALEDDLALALQALSIRIIAPIPGRSVVGFEVANKQRSSVLFGSIINSKQWLETPHAIPLVLGHDVTGNAVLIDLAKMPHMLIAGSTGSGKSVALNAMVMSLLCRFNPAQLKLILVDPKRLEFICYRDIAHLLFPIITDPKSVAPILRWVVQTMQERYEHMATYNVRNVFDYQQLAAGNNELEPMPFIVIIIDELADLMMCAGRDIEELIARISQMARAAGIHLIVATQRPSVDVITGLIKVNFPCRISFKVISKIDSRTILDCAGADKLLGKGDMLLLDGTGCLRRVHGAYVSDEDIHALVDHIKAQQTPHYLDIQAVLSDSSTSLQEGDEELLGQVIAFLQSIDEISISLLQRKFRIGYNRSARIIEMLEAQGLIMPNQGTKTRKVIH